MNIVKKIYSKGVFNALDFGAESVVVLIAEKKDNGIFKVLGAGDSVSHGVQDGEVIHPGDATEAIVEALKKAERSSGTRIEKLYFNFDDAQMQSLISRGSKFLAGEGEILASDIEEAKKTAERLVGHFEKTIIYSKEAQFMIDDKDYVVDPIGAFGKKLEVFVHVLQARSNQCEAWKKLMTRSQISRCTAVPSAWSVAYGLLPKTDRSKKRLILDLGKDFINVFIFVSGRIAGYKILVNRRTDLSKNSEGLSALVKEFFLSNPDIEEILATGDMAQEAPLLHRLRSIQQVPLQMASPQGITKLNYPRYASVVGLLYVADEVESRMPMLRAEKSIFSNVKDRAVSFISEYF